MSEQPVRLSGGNVTGEVFRVGTAVVKPATPATAAVAQVLRHLEHVGCPTAPRWLGLDELGRQRIEYVPGALADTLPPLSADELRRLGGLICELHDALETYRSPDDAPWQVEIPPDRKELICHHDLAPWNLVRDGERWVFIDWDGAGPGSRLWDLGYAAHGFVPLHAGGDPEVDGMRLRALIDGYGVPAADRTHFLELTAAHVRGMFDLLERGARTGVQPWARLHAAGHADHWGPAAGYIEANLDRWSAVLRPP